MSRTRSVAGRRTGALALLLGTLLVSGCSTRISRLENADVRAVQPSAGQGTAPAGVSEASAPIEGAPTSERASSGQPSAQSRSGASNTAVARSDPLGGAVPENKVASNTSKPAGVTKTPSTAPQDGSPQTGSGAPTTPTPLGAKSPVVVASVGTYSGVLGSVMVPILRGGQAWVSYVNAKGGLNGHPVKLITYDDGADPARKRAQMREAVERQKAVAFFLESSPTIGETGVEYVNSVRVPVVGSFTGGEYVYSSPMYFPQATSGNALFNTMILAAAEQLLPTGKKRVATMVCVEAAQCDQVQQMWQKTTKQVGFELASQVKASITQPDFTAECLGAQRAGAQIFAIAMDSNSLVRLASSCARQNYRPVYLTAAGLIVDDWTNNPTLDGFLGASNFYPWFLRDNPAIVEFKDATNRYAKGAVGVGPLTGWVAGKLLERAGANLSEPPTSAAILQGLWGLRDETLGGLTATPLNFTDGEAPPVQQCWYTVVLQGGSWKSADNAARHCG